MFAQCLYISVYVDISLCVYVCPWTIYADVCAHMCTHVCAHVSCVTWFCVPVCTSFIIVDATMNTQFICMSIYVFFSKCVHSMSSVSIYGTMSPNIINIMCIPHF